jgi:hypothetical protein
MAVFFRPARPWRAVVVLAVVTALTAVAARPALAAPPPRDARYAAAGPFATARSVVDDPPGHPVYDIYYPADYGALGFPSPIVTWGSGTGATPTDYSVLLTHLASYGFTVIGTTNTNAGSGADMLAAARWLITSDDTAGSPFHHHLDTRHIAAVGHSQGAAGAVRAATASGSPVTAVLTFSLPNSIFSAANSGCPLFTDCVAHPALLRVPAFFVSTAGFLDWIIAGPATEWAYYRSVPGSAAWGVVHTAAGGMPLDHGSLEDIYTPQPFLGYATAWLRYRLRGDTTAAGVFSGRSPELLSNPDWGPAAVR